MKATSKSSTQNLRILPKRGISLRARVRRDGRVCYESFNVFSGRVLGRSRNFSRVVAHARALCVCDRGNFWVE